MSMFSIRKKSPQDTGWISTLMIESWGSDVVVLQGRMLRPAELSAFIAEQNGERIGLITYQLKGNACEIITLNSLQPGLGIGTALIDAVKQAAETAGCDALILYTTNDNTSSLQFYQKYGFCLEELIKDGIAPDRKLKPEIPMKAENGIPIRDYLLLKMSLKP